MIVNERWRSNLDDIYIYIYEVFSHNAKSAALDAKIKKKDLAYIRGSQMQHKHNDKNMKQLLAQSLQPLQKEHVVFLAEGCLSQTLMYQN